MKNRVEDKKSHVSKGWNSRSSEGKLQYSSLFLAANLKELQKT